MDDKDIRKMSLLAEVACDYYERGLDQNKIAERLCLSRTRVSRLLKEAEEKGIVSIHVSINYPFERHYELEERFKNRYPLKNVRILNNRNREPFTIPDDVSSLAASYIMDNIKKDMVIGTSWGTTLAQMVKHLHPSDIPVHIVQLMGSVPCSSPSYTPQGIVSGMSDLYGKNGSFLNLPLYIEDEYVKQAMCNDSNNKKILNQGMFSDMILTSVNDITSIQKKEFWLGYMTPEMYHEIIEKGAVGAIFARFFDENANEIDCAWNRRCVSISFAHIKEVPNVVLIASGREKLHAMSSVIRSGLINTLITDGTTASYILGLHT